MYDAAELLDDVLAEVRHTPGLTAHTIARRLRADAGRVRRVLAFLASDHYVALRRERGRDTYDPTF